MRIAYFDCFSGISGDMILGALIDAGLDIEELKSELKKLKLTGYDISTKRTEKKGISGTKFEVIVLEKHQERHLSDIFEIIEHSSLDRKIKNKAKDVFSALAKVEAEIHNQPVEKVHFHEVGAIDALIDIVGVMIGMQRLNIEQVVASKLHVGTGFVQCAHGTLPVPAPATLKLLSNVPIYSTGIENELVTPTGAAIITTLCENFGDIPSMKVEKIGYGAGSRDLPIPNMLRVLIGDSKIEPIEDRVLLLETNIDDMNPQFYDYVMEVLFQKGAKDVFLTPIHMKKNRPGVILSVISPLNKKDELLDVLFAETTTLGIRISEVIKRQKLERKIETVDTQFGKVNVKISFTGGKIRDIVPEYEECKKIAQEYQLPIKQVYEEVKREALEKQK
ncbi:nickel pincer cofactor biosynthesis protein LarC [candidate division KSB1 bacterium]|nr:MAG: nickel pincer cofactor biosynthesis protein LarC [candidate division KSB1 bacterium]